VRSQLRVAERLRHRLEPELVQVEMAQAGQPPQHGRHAAERVVADRERLERGQLGQPLRQRGEPVPAHVEMAQPRVAAQRVGQRRQAAVVQEQRLHRELTVP
jgi:hypothetical protein